MFQKTLKVAKISQLINNSINSSNILDIHRVLMKET